MKRVFVVGCPRSGTTLIQSFLAAHPDIRSFPESHFFRFLLTKRSRRRKFLNLGSKLIHRRLEEFLIELGSVNRATLISRFDFLIPQYIHSFTRFLDQEASLQGKSCWLEKTPGHVQYTNVIENYISDAVFIHVVRNGIDVIASLYEVTRAYPEEWNGPWSLDFCIKRWIDCVGISFEKNNDSRHLLLSYEAFVEQPENTLSIIGDFLRIPLEYSDLQKLRIMESNIVTKSESWKSASLKPIHRQGNGKHLKFEKLFDEVEKNYILERIEGFYSKYPNVKFSNGFGN